jgi:hypothetical protein
VDIGIGSTPQNLGPPLPPTVAYESRLRRLVRGIAWAFSKRATAAAAANPEESRLRELVELAKLRISDLEGRISSLGHDIRSLESEKKILALEVGKLAEVAMRDRQRVAAEAASLAGAIAKVTQPPAKPEGGQYGL